MPREYIKFQIWKVQYLWVACPRREGLESAKVSEAVGRVKQCVPAISSHSVDEKLWCHHNMLPNMPSLSQPANMGI